MALASTQSSPKKLDKHHYRILVVEDDPLIQRLFEMALGQIYTLYMAGSIEDGWTEFRNRNPHMVFIDIHLPDGSGHDLAHRIKQQTPAAYVVMATASHNSKDKVTAAKTSIDRFITKPFDKELLNRCVEDYIDRL